MYSEVQHDMFLRKTPCPATLKHHIVHVPATLQLRHVNLHDGNVTKTRFGIGRATNERRRSCSPGTNTDKVASLKQTCVNNFGLGNISEVNNNPPFFHDIIEVVVFFKADVMIEGFKGGTVRRGVVMEGCGRCNVDVPCWCGQLCVVHDVGFCDGVGWCWLHKLHLVSHHLVDALLRKLGRLQLHGIFLLLLLKLCFSPVNFSPKFL
mmetsp:Transcript_88360/g.175692  ORF Transcript_88360/g.175692 Transcript_88360/m.175692 type:complete len:207 (+) Transcript_88360:951-1571(+)